MEARTQTPTIEESSIVERVARIVSSGHEWRGTKPDYTRLAPVQQPDVYNPVSSHAIRARSIQCVQRARRYLILLSLAFVFAPPCCVLYGRFSSQHPCMLFPRTTMAV